MILYPAIDLLDGRCVRLFQGRFDQATVYDTDPVKVARDFAAAGAAALHVVDLAGSRDGVARAAGLIGAITAVAGLAVQVGGGIRSLPQALAYLEAGVDRVVLGSLAARDPEAALALIREIGPGRATLALDVRLGAAGPELAVDGWTKASGRSVAALLDRFLDAGVARVLCTDVARDGALTGPNLALYRQLLEGRPGLELLASGGVATLADLRALRASGVHGAVVGKALYEGRFTLEEMLQC